MKPHSNNDNDNDNKANVSGSFLVFSSDNLTVNNPLFERRVELATEGLEPSYLNKLKNSLSQTNALTVADYILAMKTEINLSDSYRMINLKALVGLSIFFQNKISFQTMGRREILMFLDSYRKTDTADLMHKWIGTYNLLLVILVRFFKWLYFPEFPPINRKKPAVVENMPRLKRKEQSIYKPSDLWTKEDDVLFLKYCPSKRTRCYHAVARDTSCRPHEILKLRVKDIVFKTCGNYHYAEILVNGKTGTRSIPLFDSIPYVKDWLDEHPLKGNPNSFLVAGIGRSIGRPIEISTLGMIYRKQYKRRLFPKLLEDPTVPPEDKKKIKELLRKPWNPYIRRHSALTEKSTILKEHVLRQHAGWSPRSQMHLKYLHYFGNESNESLLEAYGIVTKDRNRQDVLRPKQCPNCNEPNKPDSRFCARCRMVLTYDVYSETLESEKEQKSKLDLMEEKFNNMQSMFEKLIAGLSQTRDQRQINSVAASLFSSGIVKVSAEKVTN